MLAGVRRFLFPLLLIALIVWSARWSTRDEILRDFGSFWASGHAANQGKDPYGVYEETFRVGSPSGPPAPNLNPPVSVYPFRLVALLQPEKALRLWRYASLLVYTVVILALFGRYPERRQPLFVLWAFSIAGLWHTLELGQVYVPLLALVAGAWLLLETEVWPVGAVLLGLLVALKPNLAVWPLLLLLTQKRAAGATALATACVFSLSPLVFDGPTIFKEWLAVTPSLHETAGGMARIGGNFSFIAMTGRLGLPAAGLALSLLLLGLDGYLGLVETLDLTDAGSLGLVSGLLLGPVSWVGYTILLLPIFFARRWNLPLKIAAALLCFPFWAAIRVDTAGGTERLLVESTYSAAALLVLAGLVLQIAPNRHADAFRSRFRLLQPAPARP